ncbi:hypothetical protein EDB85DRAFT_2274597 [Lactarius pseudohatsudake]|nr:hypothetical protein EDB85DRAFT_2274597 [Lactarius pseudohatsudake]
MRVWRGREDSSGQRDVLYVEGVGSLGLAIGTGTSLRIEPVNLEKGRVTVQGPEGADFGGDSGEGRYGGQEPHAQTGRFDPVVRHMVIHSFLTVEPPELPQSRRTGGEESTQAGTETTSPPAWQLRSRVARKRTHIRLNIPVALWHQDARQYHAVQVLCAERCKNLAPSVPANLQVRCNAPDDQRDNEWTGAHNCHVGQVDSTYSLKKSLASSDALFVRASVQFFCTQPESTGVDAAPRASDSDGFCVPARLYPGSERQLWLRHPDYCRGSRTRRGWTKEVTAGAANDFPASDDLRVGARTIPDSGLVAKPAVAP